MKARLHLYLASLFNTKLIPGLLLSVMSFMPLSHAKGQPESGSKEIILGVSAGEAIYRYGVLSSGEPLIAKRDDGLQMKGTDAACINCHRRSGLGAIEGHISVPPIAGRYLFNQRTTAGEYRELPYVITMKKNRKSYTDDTLARAIREGRDAADKPLNYLMPHFALNKPDMAAVITYLKSLDRTTDRGVGPTVLHFATIITPDADPVKKHGMLDVMNRFFGDKNAVPLGATPRLRSSHKLMFMVNRQWRLHVWELKGPAETWRDQLDNFLAKEPVFAVISGLAGKNWQPVHDFCERQELPCLFPNVETPPTGADHDFYSLYFSKGVLLEAGLIGNRIINRNGGDVLAGKSVKSVRQIYRIGDSGEAAARALATTLVQHGMTVENLAIPADKSEETIAAALKKTSAADVIVLWLRPADISKLGDPPASSAAIYMSGLMGGLEHAPLPSSWRARTEFAYPFELPDRRIVGVNFAFGWFRIRNVPVVAPRIQTDTYLALGLLSETLKHMADTFLPDYLVERMEDMLDHRVITGYYPRLTLATGQRFSSKGGYMVHFSGPEGTKVAADGGWTVP